ncbi:SET domain-containing protein [Candidatus Beckwithbacteria bacterium]|nr:SET domain-containing protein [Candidatus Beckwithbacteria bacterium]
MDYLDNKIVLMQAPEKYINHSCDPNVYVKTVSGLRKVYAIKKLIKEKRSLMIILLMGITMVLLSAIVVVKIVVKFIKETSLNYQRKYKSNIYLILILGLKININKGLII